MLRKPFIPIEDDTEDAPWMVMGTPQYNAVHAFYGSLQSELRSRPHPPFLAAMLPVLFKPALSSPVEQLAPDVLVARVPDHPRSSYDIAREGVPPAFVLEVVSPWSQSRDLGIKVDRYERMGIQEYALFAPETSEGRLLLTPQLRGFRLDPSTRAFVEWHPDPAGRLFSDVLGLWLAVRNRELRVQRPDGIWIPTPLEDAAAREREKQARLRAEAEVDRLRAELQRHRESPSSNSD